MDTISIQAHFDGKRILLDEPFEIEPNTKLIVTILPKGDAEHGLWIHLSSKRLREAYGDDEDEYSLDVIREANPDYEGR